MTVSLCHSSRNFLIILVNYSQLYKVYDTLLILLFRTLRGEAVIPTKSRSTVVNLYLPVTICMYDVRTLTH